MSMVLWGQQVVATTPIGRLAPGKWQIGGYGGVPHISIGQLQSDFIEIFGRQVPLPGGTWVLAGVGVDPNTNHDVRGYGVVATLILFKLEAQTVQAFALVHANAIAIDGGWGISRDCQRSDLPFTKIYENGEQHAMCAFIRPITTTTTVNAHGGRGGAPHISMDLTAWQDALALARQHKWRVPTKWYEVGLRICDWHDVLDIRYAFATTAITGGTATGVPTSQNLLITDDAKSVLTSWIDTMLPRVYLGFRRSLAGQPQATMPGTTDPALQGYWGNITPESGLSNSTFSMIKVIVNRLINMSTSVGIVYLFVGNIYLATTLQITSSTFHGGINYIEELLWNTYGPQRLRHAGTYDFTYVGEDGHNQ